MVYCLTRYNRAQDMRLMNHCRKFSYQEGVVPPRELSYHIETVRAFCFLLLRRFHFSLVNPYIDLGLKEGGPADGYPPVDGAGGPGPFPVGFPTGLFFFVEMSGDPLGKDHQLCNRGVIAFVSSTQEAGPPLNRLTNSLVMIHHLLE